MNFTLIRKKYLHFGAGHISNAFYVYQKSEVIRFLLLLLIPFIVAIDDYLAQLPEYRQWAEDCIWLLQFDGCELSS